MDSTFSNPADQAGAAAGSYTQALLDLLGDRDPFEVQEATAPALRRIVAELDDEALRRPEAPGKWSILEVLGHLADSELVYGYRLRLMVAHDEPDVPGYDQDRWAERLRYRDADPEQELDRFAGLRRFNLDFLRTLPEEDWQRRGRHGERGWESVRHVFKLLAAHDLVHLRQIERIRTG